MPICAEIPMTPVSDAEFDLGEATELDGNGIRSGETDFRRNNSEGV